MPISTELLIFTRHVQRHLQKRVQALFWKPTTDVYRCEDGWLLKLELAGVNPPILNYIRATIFYALRAIERMSH